MYGNMIIRVYARRGGVTRLLPLGPLTASIYTTTYSNILRDRMAGLPIPTLSPIENVLALRSNMRGSIFQQNKIAMSLRKFDVAKIDLKQ